MEPDKAWPRPPEYIENVREATVALRSGKAKSFYFIGDFKVHGGSATEFFGVKKESFIVYRADMIELSEELVLKIDRSRSVPVTSSLTKKEYKAIKAASE